MAQKELIETIIALGLTDSSSVEIRSEEGIEYRGKSAEEAINTVLEFELAGINFMRGSKCLGWIEVYPFESPRDVVRDYTDNDFTNTLMSKTAIKKLMEV